MATLLLLSHFSPGTSGFSLGAPDTTCGNLEPAHGVPRQSTPAPYTITPSAVEVEGGKQVLVTLQAAEGTAFKGFLVQARNSDTQEVVGTFFTTDHKYLNCENGMNVSILFFFTTWSRVVSGIAVHLGLYSRVLQDFRPVRQSNRRVIVSFQTKQ